MKLELSTMDNDSLKSKSKLKSKERRSSLTEVIAKKKRINSSHKRSSSGSSSHSSFSSPVDSKKKDKKKSCIKMETSKSSASSSSNSSNESEDEHERKKRKKALKKKLKKKMKELKKLQKKQAKLTKMKATIAANESTNGENSCSDVPIALMDRAKAMVPMTKEEWEKKQSVVRRVYDEESGRHRLIKGDGEVIEEIVSKDRHMAINKQATQGDGNFFQSRLSSDLKK